MHIFRCVTPDCIRQAESEGFFFGDVGECPDCRKDAATAFVDDGLTHLLVLSPDGPLGFWGDWAEPGMDFVRRPRMQADGYKDQSFERPERTGVVRGYVACRPRLAKQIVRMDDNPVRVTCPACRKAGGL